MSKGIEAIIEAGLKTLIETQLTADEITGVRVDTITNGIVEDEMVKPFIWVGCAPVEHLGASNHQWTGQVEVRIRTAHLTGKDRDAATLVELLASVGYALDFGSVPTSGGINSIAIRRLQGEWEFADSTNGVNIPVEIIRAC